MIYHYNFIDIIITDRICKSWQHWEKETGKNKKTEQNKIDHTDKKRHHNKTMEQTVLAVKQQIKQLDEE